MSGDGRFTKQSGISAASPAFWYLSEPSVIVHPRAQKEEIGARLDEPS
jgi:hypothetical protein